ncbi:hypothetical protein ABZT02_19400 [Streptomyces sp. NPDC005402]
MDWVAESVRPGGQVVSRCGCVEAGLDLRVRSAHVQPDARRRVEKAAV